MDPRITGANLTGANLTGANFYHTTMPDGSLRTSATAVQLDKSALSLNARGELGTLVATVVPADATNKKVTWSSSDPTVATVDANGVVTPLKVGTATITVTTEDGSKTASSTVTVKDPVIPVTGVTLDKPTLSLIAGESTATLTATVSPVNTTDKTVRWSSSNPSIAGVVDGVVTPLQPGTTTITATLQADSTKFATSLVTVEAATTTPDTIDVTGVALDQSSLSLTAGGATGTLIATVHPDNATNKTILWSSSNPTVATVVGGVVTPLHKGTTTITAMSQADNTKLTTSLVTVEAATTTPDTIEVTGISLDQPSLSLTEDGATGALHAMVSPTNATNKKVTWSSSDPTVATVDANGVVTPLKTGTTTITVTAQDGSFTAITTVSVQAGGGSGDGGNSTPTPSSPVTSNNGKVTIPAGKSGSVSLDSEVIVEVPANAKPETLAVTIQKLENQDEVSTEGFYPLSPVYEITKDVSGTFDKPVTLIFSFAPAKVGNGKPAIYYFDETAKKWVKVGGTVSGNKITAEVNHFTKFAVLTEEQLMPEKPVENTNPPAFTDIQGHWAEARIKEAQQKGIAGGYPNGAFRPNETITRVQFASLITKALKLTEESNPLSFTDKTTIPNWARNSVANTVKAGIVRGYKDNTFRPGQSITRVEMVGMITKAMKWQPSSTSSFSFADEKQIPVWAKGAVAAAAEKGIVHGKDANRFAPNDTATRAEAIVLLLNMLESKQ